MTIGSLFAGIGGIDLAFEQAGFNVAWANEYNRYACSTYRHNFKKGLLYDIDIRNLNPDSLERVDILAAGFPCQSFSVCGNQKGFKDERGNLFFEIMRVADAIRPPVIFLENVANLTEHDNGKTFNIIHNELVSRGYVIRYLIADASDYGMAQHRTRTYIVAFRNFSISRIFSFPQKSDYQKTVFEVIDRTKRAPDEYYIDERSRNYDMLNKKITDNNQIYRFSDYGIQSGKDGISFTLKANMGTWKNRVPIIVDDFGMRTITPAECLALQGFPGDYSFPEIPKAEMYKQCGNTVCVPVVYAIASEIAKAFLL